MKFVKRFLSRYDGYSRCEKCRVSWKYMETGPSVRYDESDPDVGVFCLCPSCWESSSVEEIVEFFRQSWERYDKTPAWVSVEDTIRKEVQEKKIGDKGA